MKLIKKTEEIMDYIKRQGKPVKWQFIRDIKTDGYILPDGRIFAECRNWENWIQVYSKEDYEKCETHDYGDYFLVIFWEGE